MNTSKLKVIFVDDDENMLSSLRRAFLLTRKQIYLKTANSGNSALQILEEENFDVIISDMGMPGMNGGELLAIVAQKHPRIIRFILSGYIEKKQFSYNRFSVHRYFIKPIDLKDLEAILLKIFELLKKFTLQANDPSLTQINLRYCYDGSICTLHESLESNEKPYQYDIQQIRGNAFHSLQILKSHYSMLNSRESTTIHSVNYLLEKLDTTEVLERLGCLDSKGCFFTYNHYLEPLLLADHLIARLSAIIVKLNKGSSFTTKNVFTIATLKNVALHILFTNFNGRWDQAKKKSCANDQPFRKSLYEIFNVDIDLITEYFFLISGIPDIFITRLCTSNKNFVVDTLSTSVLIATQIVYNSNPSKFFFLDTEIPEHIKGNQKFIELEAKALDVLDNKKLPLKFIQKSEKFVAYNYE